MSEEEKVLVTEIVTEPEPKKRKPRAKKEPTAITRAEPDEAALTTTEQYARDLLNELSKWEIRSEDDMKLAGQIVADVRQRRLALEAERDSFTKPLLEVKNRIFNRFKVGIGFFKAAEDLVSDDKIANYRRKAVEAQDKALAAVAESGGVADPSTLAVAHGTSLLELPDNLREKVTFQWKCVNFALVPPEYKRTILDEEKINAVVGRDGGQTNIPGLEVTRHVEIHNKAVRT